MADLTFREHIDCMADAIQRIQQGHDSGKIWATTLMSHAKVMLEDFDMLGEPLPSYTNRAKAAELIARLSSDV